MIAAWVVAACSLLGIMAGVARLIWMTSQLVAKVDQHLADARLHGKRRRK